MRAILAAAHAVEHNIRIVAVRGNLGTQTTGTRHLASIVAHDRARR